jgi:hypothetical protein
MARDNVTINVDTAALDKALRDLERQMPRAADNAVRSSATDFHTLLQSDILNREGGAEDPIIVRQKAGAQGSKHYPSLPGEPPSPITSVYRSSWSYRRVSQALYRVSTADERGPWLEYGTRTMAPRPHVRPAVEQHRPVHIGTLINAVQRVNR